MLPLSSLWMMYSPDIADFAAMFFIAIGVFALLFLTVVSIYCINMGKNGRFSSGAVYGITDDSVLTKNVAKKIDVLTKIIDEYYLGEYTKKDLEAGLYKGLLAGLNDPYTVYYTDEDYKELTQTTEGEFEGIGAYLSQDTDTMEVRVVEPMPGSPAEKAGLLADDIIVEVDGEDVVGENIDTTVSKIRGEKGTTVNIGIRREGEDDILHFDIKRESVQAVTVESKMLDKSIGYIRISEFDDLTYEQFKKAFRELKREEMRGLVIDLRENPGGSVFAAVDIADELLGEGLVVYTEDKNGTRKEYSSDADNYYDDPLVIIVDGNSASAAEILTGAVKDYKAGIILGTKTYGKGIVQQVLPFGDGSGVKITIANYFTPKGTNIHGIGITPDEELEFDYEAYLDDEKDNQLERAIEIIEEQLK